MADYIVNKGIQGRPSVNLQSTSLVGPRGPQGPAGGYWISNASGIHTLSNVGIGTDNPTLDFEVLGQCRFNGDVDIDGNSELFFGSGNLTLSSNNGQSSILTSDYLLFINSGSVDLKTNGNTAVGITSTGFVGIGTTNPTVKLDVRGDIKSGINTSTGLILTSPNGTQYRLIVDDSGNLTTVSL